MLVWCQYRKPNAIVLFVILDNLRKPFSCRLVPTAAGGASDTLNHMERLPRFAAVVA